MRKSLLDGYFVVCAKDMCLKWSLFVGFPENAISSSAITIITRNLQTILKCTLRPTDGEMGGGGGGNEKTRCGGGKAMRARAIVICVLKREATSEERRDSSSVAELRFRCVVLNKKLVLTVLV